jgi:hypothetical protein
MLSCSSVRFTAAWVGVSRLRVAHRAAAPLAPPVTLSPEKDAAPLNAHGQARDFRLGTFDFRKEALGKFGV